MSKEGVDLVSLAREKLAKKLGLASPLLSNEETAARTGSTPDDTAMRARSVSPTSRPRGPTGHTPKRNVRAYYTAPAFASVAASDTGSSATAMATREVNTTIRVGRLGWERVPNDTYNISRKIIERIESST